jgi:hypothetical protein
MAALRICLLVVALDDWDNHGPPIGGRLQMAQPAVAWGMAMTKMVAAAMRCSDHNVVAKRCVQYR